MVLTTSFEYKYFLFECEIKDNFPVVLIPLCVCQFFKTQTAARTQMLSDSTTKVILYDGLIYWLALH